MKHTVCAITGSRAEFGILLPLLRRLNDCTEIELRLVVTGSHLSAAYGHTVEEIERIGLPIHAAIPLPLEVGDDKICMVKNTAAAMSSFADYFSAHRPEMVIVLGDRFEIFAASAAAAMLGIPIAHLHGGETTEGAVDEFFRHSITKMSSLHFVSCETYRRRVIQLGEAPERVFNVGALSTENIMHTSLLSREELEADIGFPLHGVPYAVVTYHPVTMESGGGVAELQEVIAAMDSFENMAYIVTLANADAGGRRINEIWRSEGTRHPNWLVVPSLGMLRYLSAVRGSCLVLGNSSSGIIEAPALHVPTVNIGDRQKGRMRAQSVIDCPPEREAIRRAMARATSPEFQEMAKHTNSPFGDGHTSEKIVAELLRYLRSGAQNKAKSFYDLPISE